MPDAIPDDHDLKVMSQAISLWFAYYEVEPDDTSCETLCSAALRLYQDGFRNADDLSTMLIGAYVGILATRISAPTTATIQ